MKQQGANAKRSKATAAVAARRVEEILRIRLDGAEFHDVVEYVAEMQVKPGTVWFVEDGRKPLSPHMIRKYIERSNKLIDREHEKSRKRLFRRHLAMRRNLYAKAINAGDVRTALAVLESEAKMLGLYPDPDQALRREIEALERRLRELVEAAEEAPTR